MSKDSLGDRMKDYEGIPRTRLVRKVPVLLRLDGKAFHTYTAGLVKPWDERLERAMWTTALRLCQEVQGARVAYVQSDEISILLADYKERDTAAWFDYDLQKIVSVSASLAAAVFNREQPNSPDERLGTFDARAWNLPRHEVVNYFVWRQQDALRNSVSMLAQSQFSASRLHGVDVDGMRQLLVAERGLDWATCPLARQRGVCIVKERHEVNGALRTRWVVDESIPLFATQREYIDRLAEPDPWAEAS
jgi:tRNA(His) 5'-end guanylyltransferase